MANIKRNDKVLVIAGKDKGKAGIVSKVMKGDNKVIVENINVAKKHQKPTQNHQEGGIVEKNMPIDISNVRAVCPKCSKATSFRMKTLADGKRARFCKNCSETLE